MKPSYGNKIDVFILTQDFKNNAIVRVFLFFKKLDNKYIITFI